MKELVTQEVTQKCGKIVCVCVCVILFICNFGPSMCTCTFLYIHPRVNKHVLLDRPTYCVSVSVSCVHTCVCGCLL